MFFPPTKIPDDTYISDLDLNILADFLNYHWIPIEFEVYYTLRDSGLYDRAWDMLEHAAQDMIADNTIYGARHTKQIEDSIVDQLTQAIGEHPNIQLSSSVWQYIKTVLESELSTLDFNGTTM